jgi:hypothetical protein
MAVAISIGCGSNIPATVAGGWQSVATSQLDPAASKFPNRVIASRTIVGYFQNFSWGDYFYAVVKTKRGNISFMLNPPSPKLLRGDEDCFLAHHQQQRLRIQYDTIDTYIPQAGGYHSIEVIRKIQTDRLTLATWRKSLSPTRLKQCRQLVEKATKSN